jgi:hypothetical protein
MQNPYDAAPSSTSEGDGRIGGGTYVDQAFIDNIIGAGHAPEAPEAVVTSVPAPPATADPRIAARARRAVLRLYLVTFAILSVGMFLDSRPSTGGFMPTGPGGIPFLAISLFIAFVLAHVWIASPRRSCMLIGAVTAAGSLQGAAVDRGAITGFLVGAAVAVVAWKAPPRPQAPNTRFAILISLPAIALLAVVGAYISSDLPIPGRL